MCRPAAESSDANASQCTVDEEEAHDLGCPQRQLALLQTEGAMLSVCTAGLTHENKQRHKLYTGLHPILNNDSEELSSAS